MNPIPGVILEVFSAACVAAGVAVFVFRFFRDPAQELAAPGRQKWFARENMRTLMWAAVAAIGSRVLLALLAYWALAAANQFGDADIRLTLSKYGFDKMFPALQDLFSRWDAPHYLDIAKYGYTSDLKINGGEQHWFIVFYPLYPALIALVKPLVGSEFTAGTVISWLCLAGACYWIYRLARIDSEAGEARRAIKYLLIFPAAVFLGAPYTESLFLLLTAVCLYALRKHSWWLAGVAGFFAACTRNVGVLLVLPFAVEAADSLGLFADWGKIKTGAFWLGLLGRCAWAVLIPLGMGVYLLINQLAYGNPFAFLQIQNDHWGQHMQPFWKTVQTTWENLIGSSRGQDEQVFLWAPQFLGIAAVLAALPFMVKRLRPSYAAYLLVYVVVALSPAWLLSFNRYMMGCVPLLLGIAALTKRKTADIALSVVFVVMMLFLAAGFFMWKMVV